MARQTPIVFGLGVLAVGALVLFLTFKRKKANKENNSKAGSSGSSKKSKSIDEALLEFTLPNVVIPFVVGKNEEILKSIEQATGTKIKFFEQDSNNQLCQIKGSDVNSMQKAEAMIKDKADHPPLQTESILIPSTAANRVIGLCGEMLEEICSKSQAKVWVERATDSSEMDTVKISGTQAQINAAKVHIEHWVRIIVLFK